MSGKTNMSRKKPSLPPDYVPLIVCGLFALIVWLARRPTPVAAEPVRLPLSARAYERVAPPPAPPIQPRVWEPHPPISYETIGFLEGDGVTRPLLGRRSSTRRHRWHYSTTNDARSSIGALRLPVSTQDRKCTAEIGCEELYSGDMVTIPGVDAPMRVQLYEKHFG